MKNLKLMILVLLCSITMNLFAEENRFTVEGETYTYNSNSGWTRNAKNTLNLSHVKCLEYSANNPRIYWFNIIKKVFSKERIRQLAEEKSSVKLCVFWESTGLVKEFQYMFYSGALKDVIQPDEILMAELIKFEKEALNSSSRVEFHTSCTNQKYFYYYYNIRFTLVYEWLLQQQ